MAFFCFAEQIESAIIFIGELPYPGGKVERTQSLAQT